MESTDSKDNSILSISIYHSYVVLFVIFLGITRLGTFYHYFDISLSDHFTIFELVTSVSDIMAFVFFFIPLALIHVYQLSENRNIMHLENAENLSPNTSATKGVLGFLRNTYFAFPSEIMATVIVAVLCLLSHFAFQNPNRFQLLLFAIAFLLPLLVMGLLVRARDRLKRFQASNQTRILYIHVMYGLILTFAAMAYANYQVHRIVKGKSTNGVKLEYPDGVVFTSNSSKYFIGQSREYVFLYDEKTHTTEKIMKLWVKKIIFP